MTEKELMKWVLVIVFIGGAILLVRWLIKKFKSDIVDKSEAELVDKEDFMITDMVSSSQEQTKGETIPIYKFKNIVEATAIKAELEENNISCVVTSFEDLAYDGMYQAQKGWGMLQVFESDREKAEELIKIYLEEQAKEKNDLEPSEKLREPITVFKVVAIILGIGMVVSFIWAIEIIIVWFIRNIFR